VLPVGRSGPGRFREGVAAQRFLTRLLEALRATARTAATSLLRECEPNRAFAGRKYVGWRRP
jgi:hypothetical protein